METEARAGHFNKDTSHFHLTRTGVAEFVGGGHFKQMKLGGVCWMKQK